LGSDRSRYESAADLQQYVGIAPVTKRSGKSQTVHWRWGCPKFLRQSFHEFAGQSVCSSAWAGAYYQQQLSKGNSHHQALRSLAFKWIRIIYRCWHERTPLRFLRFCGQGFSEIERKQPYAIQQQQVRASV
jgi:hypothetical protein